MVRNSPRCCGGHWLHCHRGCTVDKETLEGTDGDERERRPRQIGERGLEPGIAFAAAQKLIAASEAARSPPHWEGGRERNTSGGGSGASTTRPWESSTAIGSAQ